MDATHFPSLENLLKNIVEVGSYMDDIGCESKYKLLCKAIARRVFKNKTEADIALDASRLEEWANGLEGDEKKEIKAQLKKISDERAAGSTKIKQWYKMGKVCDEDDDDDDFSYYRVWKAYKEFLSGVPTKPLRGPPKWDINKWTAAERSAFEFKTGGDEGFFF